MSTATTPPTSTSSVPASPQPASVSDTPLKATDARVKKPAQKKAKKSAYKHSQKSKLALQKMQAFFKAHRSDSECKDMTFNEQQKVLGKLWKASPENPKNTVPTAGNGTGSAS